MLEVLIANRRVAVKNSQPFPLGNRCSSTGIRCSGKGSPDPCRNVGLALLVLWHRKNSRIKTQPWCSFSLEDELPTSSRRLLARKYPAKGALQSLQLFLYHQARAPSLPTLPVCQPCSAKAPSLLCSVFGSDPHLFPSPLCWEGLAGHVATQIVVVCAGDSLLGLAGEAGWR